MNPGSVFGSGFGQSRMSSPFGTSTGSASGSSTPFGTSIGSIPSGPSPQIFGSVNTTNAGFGNVGSSSGFGLSHGSDSKPPMFGSPGPSSNAGTVFGSGTSSPAFGAVTPTLGFGAGGNQSVGFGSSNPSSSGFGTSGFGTGTTSVSAAGNSGTQFGTGFNTGTTFASANTASPVFGTTSTGSSFKGPSFGTGGSGFGGGATPLGSSSSGFGTGSAGIGSSGSGFGTGSSGFGRGATGFGTSTPGFGQISSGSSSVTPVFGSTSASGFGGGSSMFGSFTSPPSTSSTLSTAQNQSNPSFGGSSVFGVKAPTTTAGSQGFISSSSITPANSIGSSVFGSNVSTGFGGGSTSTFGQTPATTVVGSIAKGSVFGANTGVGSSGTSSVFGAVSKAGSFGTNVGTPGSVFGGGQPSSVGGFSSGGVAPPSYSASISSGQAGPFTASSTAAVFGGASRTAPGGASVFGGTSKTTSGEGSGFGGTTKTPSEQGSVFSSAPITAAGQGSVFGGASRTTSGQSIVFGDASRTSGEGTVFGGPPKTTSADGSTFGRAGRSVIKQDTLQQPTPHTASQSSVLGGSHSFGKVPAQSETIPSAASTHPPSAASVFGGKSNFSSTFGGATQKPATGVKTEMPSSVFGGRQTHEQKQDLSSRPLFSATSRPISGSEGQVIKHELDHSRGRSGAATGGEASGLRQDSSQSQKRSAAGNEEGAMENKRGRIEGQQDRTISSTGSHFRGQPSISSRTPDRTRRRLMSCDVEDISSKMALVCKGIAANLNQGKILRSHFSQFGKVKLVRPVPAKRYALVLFETHEAAARAKKHGTMLPGQDKPLTIFWKSSVTDRSPGASEDSAQNRLPWGRSGASEAEPEPGASSSHSQQHSLPSSVAAELACMSGADVDHGSGQKQSVRNDRSARSRMTRRELSPRGSETAQSTRSRTPPPSSSSSTSSVSGGSSGSLSKTTNATVSSLRKMVGTTTMDKVSILDIRDKLIRQKTPKQTSGGIHSRAFVGTCPDMCPEKERLYREEVRRLSIYEIIPGSSTLTGSTSLVDHSRAVKEYSRSSADQDEPLPHELRPLPSLTLTMNYLLVEIADCGEDGKWAEWYDFLWNRTRSIRKEITQQQLCSQEVVDLLEKCVRFHIYCAERLCMEDMMVFDSKINNENLTKCLQTLKELYADMQNKHGLYCPNEAEFRAYIALMNLNEGDTLREVQQFRSEVRSSPEIAFAVKAYSALYSNNYVRFFRLVKNASFLNACILHRYFNQIRARAVQIILKSHTAGQKKVGFALSELQRLLMFESEEEIREFCSYYGLQAEGADLSLDRSKYVEPETSIPSWRAVRLVESKRLRSVGEVINGCALQPVGLSAPQCSFDEQGRFIGSLEGLPDDGQESAVKTTSSMKPPPPEPSQSSLRQGIAANTAPAAATSFSGIPAAAAATAATPFNAALAGSKQAASAAVSEDSTDARKQQLKTSGEVLKTIARDLFFEVINEHAHQVAMLAISEAQTKLQVEVHIAADLITSTVSDLAKQVSLEVVDGEKTRQNQLLAAEKREREARVAADVLDTLIDDAVEAEAKKIALEEIEEEEAREEEERKERCMLAVQSEVLREVMGEMVGGVAEEVHQVDVVARLQLLADLQKAVELKRSSQWLAIWRKALKVRQRQKRAMLDFPCAPPMQPASQRLQGLHPDRPAYAASLVPGKAALLLNHRAQMTVSSPFESEKRSLILTAQLSVASLLNSLQRSRAWQPLYLADVLRSPLNQAIQQWPSRFVKESTPLNVQWKLLLSLPGDMEEEEEGDDDRMTGEYMPDQLMPVLKEWLCAKFNHGDSSANNSADSSKRNVLSQYSIEVTSSAVTASKLRVGVCVRNVPEFAKEGRKEQPTKEQGLSITKGTSAILFLLPHADTTDDTTWLAARLRLARLLEAKPFLPATPLALLLPCGLSTSPGSITDEVTGRLAIQDFQDQGLVSDVAVVELAIRAGQPPDVAVAAPVLQTQVSDAVKFLASKLPEPPDLRQERLGDIVEDTLTQHFFTPVLQDLRCRLNLNKLHQAPNTLIGLYNSVLDHVCMALTSPSLQDISWPPPELQLSAATREDWNSKKHLGDIYELVSSLRLPWFHYQDSASTEWSQVCHDVWTFVNAVVKKRCNSAVSLTSRISRVLAHTCLQFENLCSLTQNEDHCTPTYVNAPWTDIVVACAEFRLQRLHNWKEEEEDVGGDLEVLFEEEELEEFEPPASWVQALLDSEDTDERQTVENTMEQASIVHFAMQPAEEEENGTESNAQMGRTADNNDRTSATVASRSEQVTAASRNDLPENIRSVWETSENLLLHVEEERRQAQAFERYLQKALREDTSPDWNCSAIFSSPRASRVMATPAVVTSATPSIPFASLRQQGGSARSLSTPKDPGSRRGSLPLRHSMEPRRLAELSPGAGSFAEREGDAQMDRSHPETLPLSQGVELFKENLQAQKYANELFEKRLQSLLES